MTDIDYLLFGNRLCARGQQPGAARNAEQREKWLASFALD